MPQFWLCEICSPWQYKRRPGAWWFAASQDTIACSAAILDMPCRWNLALSERTWISPLWFASFWKRDWVFLGFLRASPSHHGFQYWIIWVCLKIVYNYTQWFCWSLSLLNGYNWGYTPFSDIPILSHGHGWFGVPPWQRNPRLRCAEIRRERHLRPRAASFSEEWILGTGIGKMGRSWGNNG